MLEDAQNSQPTWSLDILRAKPSVVRALPIPRASSNEPKRLESLVKEIQVTWNVLNL
jgi:hypothetical protein